jgi:hypothetical protein
LGAIASSFPREEAKMAKELRCRSSPKPMYTTSIFYQIFKLKSRKLSDDKYFLWVIEYVDKEKGCELFRPQPFAIV